MKQNPSNPTSALQHFEPEPAEAYSIETVVHLTQTPRHLIGVYCRYGLIAPLSPPESDGWRFDDEAIRELRRIERLRRDFDLELPVLRLIVALRRETERLREEIRGLRAR